MHATWWWGVPGYCPENILTTFLPTSGSPAHCTFYMISMPDICPVILSSVPVGLTTSQGKYACNMVMGGPGIPSREYLDRLLPTSGSTAHRTFYIISMPDIRSVIFQGIPMGFTTSQVKNVDVAGCVHGLGHVSDAFRPSSCLPCPSFARSVS